MRGRLALEVVIHVGARIVNVAVEFVSTVLGLALQEA